MGERHWQDEKRAKRMFISLGPTVLDWIKQEQRRLFQKHPGDVVRIFVEMAYEASLKTLPLKGKKK